MFLLLRMLVGLASGLLILFSTAAAKASHLQGQAKWILPPVAERNIRLFEVRSEIRNRSGEVQRGELLFKRSSDEQILGRSRFVVAPKGVIELRSLVFRTRRVPVSVEIVSASGHRSVLPELSANDVPQRSLLLDLKAAPAIARLIEGAVDPRPTVVQGYAGRSNTQLKAVAPSFDPHGDPILPRQLAGYAAVAAALSSSSQLLAMPPADRSVLLDFVAAGGSLALHVANPKDLQHPLLQRLLGGPIQAATPSAALSAPLGTAKSEHLPYKLKDGTTAHHPPATERLRGFSGGNLKASAYGQRATYGRGSLYLLGFDPYSRDSAETAFVSNRLYGLLLDARQQLAQEVFPPAAWPSHSDHLALAFEPSRNQGNLLVGLLALLCVYAVAAGPLTFRRIRRRKKPLRGYLQLASFSGGTFAVLLALGSFHRGCGQSATTIGFIEAAPGMSQGQLMLVHAVHAPYRERATVESQSKDPRFRQLIPNHSRPPALAKQHNGSWHTTVQLPPAESAIVAERMRLQLPGTIDVEAHGEPGHLLIHNATRHRIGPAFIWLPKLAQMRHAAAIAPGERVNTRDLPTFGAIPSTTGNNDLFMRQLHASDDEVLRQVGTDLKGLFRSFGHFGSLHLQHAPMVLARLWVPYGLEPNKSYRQRASRVYVHLLGVGARP